MAFEKVSQRTNDHVAVYSCLSADTRDTDGVFAGDICLVDNGNVEKYTGTQWIQTSFGGAVGVQSTAGSVWSYGDYPTTVADIDSFAATTPTDNDVVMTTADVSSYTSFYVISTGGSFSVQATIDGTNYSGDLKLEDLEGTTAASRDYANTTTAGKLYMVECKKAVKLRILANGTTTIANGQLLKGN